MFICGLTFLGSSHSMLELELKYCIFFDGNRECYCFLYLAQRVTRMTDSNYKPKEGSKSGSLKLCSQIWDGNIFPISRGQSFLNQNFGKKYICGKNLSRNFVFVQRKLRELLSFVFGPSSYPKYGFQLCVVKRA